MLVAADSVQVSALGRELRNLATDTGALDWLARQTGGRSVQWEEAKGLLDSLRPESAKRETFERLPLWNLPAALVLLLLLASAEWAARRRWGAQMTRWLAIAGLAMLSGVSTAQSTMAVPESDAP